MKPKMLSLLFVLCCLCTETYAQDLPQAASYTVNFDRSTPRTRNDRTLTAIVLDGTSMAVADPSKMYNDMTNRMFTVKAGTKVQPSVVFSGQWMQTYIYIDLNGNGQMDVKKPGPSGLLEPENELVCFSGMELDNGLFNSAGQSLNNLSGVQPPAFTIPEDLEPGVYMMRWKIDWNSCDPGGRVDEANSIIKNGGAIVDVLLKVTDDVADDGYELVFSDEFDQPDGSLPDPKKWHASTRRNATWNRWISKSPEVAYIQDGALVCRAIPNPNTSTDNVPMLTGAVETSGLFSFTYGKVEVRLRTNPHTGNFPAAWMMPQPPCATWPNAGEIDIFESIDKQQTAYHTIHSHWTYDLGHKNEPKSSFSEWVDVSQWHIYGLEWLEDGLLFSVDGKVVAVYNRSTDDNALSQGQWPFDHPFYLILNQSVGNGSWASKPDTGHTYETRFDYVRVYQKRAEQDGIENLLTEEHNAESKQALSNEGRNATIDLSGKQIKRMKANGLYIHNGRKVVVRSER